MFRSIILRQDNGSIISRLEEMSEAVLPEQELLVRVAYSTINYKDGMILNGIGKLVRQYPHIPGIDAVGTVERSNTSQFEVGDLVILGGHRFGEITWGGYSELVAVSSDMVVHLPSGITPRQAMALGTAGLSAMLAVDSLEEQGLVPSNREVLVTGAAGGVGSVAVALLSTLGYKVAASTGRLHESHYLTHLGASSVVDRSEFSELGTKPLEAERWSGCIDNVGGAGLGKILKQMSYQSSIASVGLAGGSDFEANVMPFLLRGVNILGIDSVSVSSEKRYSSWKRLAETFPLDLLDDMTEEISISEVLGFGGEILRGKIKGRIVVSI